MYNEIHDCVPNDHSRQVNSRWMVRRIMSLLPQNPAIIDLGCGTGESLDMFRQLNPTCIWTGVDIKDSPEVRERKRIDAEFLTFDGINIPAAPASVDLVYSRQVLEHVRYPEKLLADVCRVLKPGGFFVGQTSHLEPYHSYSFWNFTPYGFRRLVEEAGMTLKQIRPSIDGATLVERTYNNRTPNYGVYFNSESPLNQQIDTWGQSSGRNHRQINVRKLSLCGQFVFLCDKPATNNSGLTKRVAGNYLSWLRRFWRSNASRVSVRGQKRAPVAAVPAHQRASSQTPQAMPSRPTVQLTGGKIIDLPPLEKHHIPRVIWERGLIDYEPLTMAACLALCESNTRTFVDVGANIGLYCLNIASTLGTSCAAFEPAEEAATALTNAAKLLQLPITVSQCAISDRQGSSDFYISPKSDMSHSLQAGFRSGAKPVKVRVTTLDEELSSIPSGVIKIDAESYEFQILKGAERILERDRPALVLEILPGAAGAEVTQLLNRLGYNLVRLDSETFRAKLRNLSTRDRDGDLRNCLAFPAEIPQSFFSRLDHWLAKIIEACPPTPNTDERTESHTGSKTVARVNPHCPICGGDQFKPYRGRPNESCCQCGAKERTRLMAILLQRLPRLPSEAPILHFAPELPLAQMLFQTHNELYHPLDLNPQNFSLPLPVQRFDMTADFSSIPNDSVGMLLHSHVLEHLPCPIEPLLRTMNEKIAKGGYHVFCVPLLDVPYDEDWSDALTDADRVRRFGQHDHVRAFSTHDFSERFLSCFSAFDQVSLTEFVNTNDLLQHAIRSRSVGIGSQTHTFIFRRRIS